MQKKTLSTWNPMSTACLHRAIFVDLFLRNRVDRMGEHSLIKKNHLHAANIATRC